MEEIRSSKSNKHRKYKRVLLRREMAQLSPTRTHMVNTMIDMMSKIFPKGKKNPNSSQSANLDQY